MKLTTLKHARMLTALLLLLLGLAITTLGIVLWAHRHELPCFHNSDATVHITCPHCKNPVHIKVDK